MQRSAVFSPCGHYRYSLWRRWEPAGALVMVIGLNPSTADAQSDDPTVRRCIGYAKDWGYGGLCLTNLFAFRARRPEAMKAAADPVGPENDLHLLAIASQAALKLAAWGVHGRHLGRDAELAARLPGLHCLRLSKGGHPTHPLYLPRGLSPTPWAGPRDQRQVPRTKGD
ncbi:DUF1643 domain-containing protein [Synechococcus sp. 1G10]|uniref:DUF1643 domain-containing protein n=1 Tax=Synechococcus sp. 1G10 TaxID=2025605 RepID=UPI000B9995CE|nr:DUF1643 domain-containing protein [Synechococcus sp. 1G10]